MALTVSIAFLDFSEIEAFGPFLSLKGYVISSPFYFFFL